MTPKVLIVDDEPDYLELLEFNLLSQGFQVCKAGNGIEGLHKARAEAPDVILLDLMLPDLDGFAICEILRDQPSTRDIPVIILSALDGAPARARCTAASARQYLKKGIDFESLAGSVRAAVEDRQERVRNRLGQREASALERDRNMAGDG